MQHVEVHVEGQSIGALATPFTVGRDPECDVILPDSSVSRRHLRVSSAPSGLLVEDMGSSNGTWLDGRRIQREYVQSGHPFVVGRVAMMLRFVQQGSAPAYEARRPAGSPAEGGGHRHDTLAVDIPQGYFDPSPTASPTRTFECPGCGRRLRCASTVRRVKCRNCNEIIRFENDVPQLERLLETGISVPSAHAPMPRSVPSEPPGDNWVSDAKANVEKKATAKTAESAPQAPPPPVPTARGGWTMALVLITLGGLVAIGSTIASLNGVANLLPVVVLGSAIALAGFVFVAAMWIQSVGSGRSESGGTVAERLKRLEELRREKVISEDEYHARRQAILKQL
ncbi:MAG: FHA domain-containing protein [Myxococcales bacterium]|nr:FHA domain-containing protein [Myxococcales bacterium]